MADKQSQFIERSGGPELQASPVVRPLAQPQIDILLDIVKSVPLPKPEDVKKLLEGVGFNEMSVRRLMEVNPKLAVMAAEAKVQFDNDPRNCIFDKAGKQIGHKTFEVQHNGGYRTVADQKVATGAGNSNANANKYQSHHQWGEGVDFWIYDKTVDSKGKWSQTPLPDKEKFHVYYERMADFMAASPTAAFNVVRRDEMRIKLNGVTDWGHIQLPDRFREQWHRDPKTGVVVINGERQPGTGIDPKLHPNAGPTYATTGGKKDSKFVAEGAAGPREGVGRAPESNGKKTKVAHKSHP